MKGTLLVIDGLDGSGKSTQIDILADNLGRLGKKTQKISFPDYDQPSSALVKMYLAGEFGSRAADVNAYAASSFYAVDRYASFQKFWRGQYEAGGVIIAARYTTSNAIHQMAKMERRQWDAFLEWLFDYEYEKLGLPKPDGVFFLDMPPEVSARLLTGRYHGEEGKKDIHEKDIEYIGRCREAAFYAAGRLGWEVLPCNDGDSAKPVEVIARTLLEKVEQRL